MPRSAEEMLPADLLARASLSGNEYAWPLDDILEVIEAARKANLVNLGGQLQFRLPGGGTCECHWVEVDTYQSAETSLPWRERVARTAEVAARDFTALRGKVDFLAEGWKGFPTPLSALVAEGGDPMQAMCFVWYSEGEEEAIAKGG